MKKIENVVYKVVEKQTRHCTNWSLYVKGFEFEDHITRKKLLKKYPALKLFLPRYLKNTIVKMAPKSIGILTFDNYKSAELFIKNCCMYNGKIIKVKGINQLKNSLIVGSCAFDPTNLIERNYFSNLAMHAPSGTLFFEKVKVLE
jgi:hypothetical protein